MILKVSVISHREKQHHNLWQKLKHSRRLKPRQSAVFSQTKHPRIGEERMVDYIDVIALMGCGVLWWCVVWFLMKWCGFLWCGVVYMCATGPNCLMIFALLTLKVWSNLKTMEQTFTKWMSLR